jgi:hypothetical protein
VLPVKPFTDPTVFDPPVDASLTCFILVTGNDVNMRAEPSTNSETVRQLTENQSIGIDGQTVGDDGFTWWRTAEGTWVRSDVVFTLGKGCTNLPTLSAP